MPGVSGLGVIREARRRLGLGLPIVIITGASTEASAIEAINLGVSGYLIKPARGPQILQTAARVLGQQAADTGR
jgi:DNA-binding response OmpR family regulator